MNRASLPRVALILAATALPALAFAQTAPSAPAPSAPASSTPASSTPGAPAGGQADTTATDAAPTLSKAASEKVDAHIKQLHDELHITQAEEPQWAQFAQVMRDNAAHMERSFARRGEKLSTMTADQNMQSYAHIAQVHATNMQKLASAFQSLYNTFPAEQKQIADALFANKAAKRMEKKKAH